MPLPSKLVYNDLSGDEIKHILAQRFVALLDQVSYLQKHITLPRVKMELQVQLTSYADQDKTEAPLQINDSVEVLSDAVDASKRGQRPDQIREQHGLPIATPMRDQFGVRDEMVSTTAQPTPPVYTPRVENARMVMANGAVVDRSGSTPQARKDATVVTQDFGPAGLSQGQFNRGGGQIEYGNRRNRDGGEVARPVLPAMEE